MKPRPSLLTRARPAAAGFSLVEILVVVSLLSVIVFGLYSVFNHTQRALRGNTTQVDVLEAGRATLDLISRDLAEASPTGLPLSTNLYAALAFPNARYWQPLLQNLPTNNLRTNYLQDLFFMVHSNNYWVGKGFFVASSANPTKPVTNGVGTLYRFTAIVTTSSRQFSTNQLHETIRLFNARSNASPVTDGIVHFRVQPYDRVGWPMEFHTRGYDTNYQAIYLASSGQPIRFQPPLPVLSRTNVILREDSRRMGTTDFSFLSNSVPASLDLEFGILEAQAVDKLKAMPPAAAGQYLLRQAGAVHLFNKRVPIRNTKP